MKILRFIRLLRIVKAFTQRSILISIDSKSNSNFLKFIKWKRNKVNSTTFFRKESQCTQFLRYELQGFNAEFLSSPTLKHRKDINKLSSHYRKSEAKMSILRPVEIIGHKRLSTLISSRID